MRTSLLWVGLAVFSFTQLFIGAVVGDGIPVNILEHVVPAAGKLVKCVANDGIAKIVSNDDLITGQGGVLGAVTAPVDGVVNALPVAGPLLSFLTNTFKILSKITGLVNGVLDTVNGTIYCALGPDGTIVAVLNSVGDILMGIGSDPNVPSGLPNVLPNVGGVLPNVGGILPPNVLPV